MTKTIILGKKFIDLLIFHVVNFDEANCCGDTLAIHPENWQKT